MTTLVVIMIRVSLSKEYRRRAGRRQSAMECVRHDWEINIFRSSPTSPLDHSHVTTHTLSIIWLFRCWLWTSSFAESASFLLLWSKMATEVSSSSDTVRQDRGIRCQNIMFTCFTYFEKNSKTEVYSNNIVAAINSTFCSTVRVCNRVVRILLTGLIASMRTAFIRGRFSPVFFFLRKYQAWPGILLKKRIRWKTGGLLVSDTLTNKPPVPQGRGRTFARKTARIADLILNCIRRPKAQTEPSSLMPSSFITVACSPMWWPHG